MEGAGAEAILHFDEDLINIKKEDQLETYCKITNSWIKRWFVLTSKKLYSFKDTKEYKHPTQVINLMDIIKLKTTEGYDYPKDGEEI